MAKGITAEKPKRVMASKVVTGILLLKRVPDDETIIATVQQKTGNRNFDKNQLAFYKSKFRKGELKGQDGKKGIIAQATAHRKAKGSKAGDVVEN